MIRHPEWHQGYDAAKERIMRDGWEKVRQEFNAEYPPGHSIAPDRLRYALGYFQAIADSEVGNG